MHAKKGRGKLEHSFTNTKPTKLLLKQSSTYNKQNCLPWDLRSLCAAPK